MLPRKPPKRLFKNKDVIHVYQHDRSAGLNRSAKGRLKHMTRDHADVLQNIEFALLKEARADASIDDRMIDQSLRSGSYGTELPEDADIRVVRLCAMLKSMREFREDVPDDIWIAGLRTVADSVRRHSTLTPGEASYIDFVKGYVL
jgi:hypothetical protein